MVQGQAAGGRVVTGITNKKILLKWPSLKSKIETIGHQMPDGWWYVYLPIDNDWHFVPDGDVELLTK